MSGSKSTGRVPDTSTVQCSGQVIRLCTGDLNNARVRPTQHAPAGVTDAGNLVSRSFEAGVKRRYASRSQRDVTSGAGVRNLAAGICTQLLRLCTRLPRPTVGFGFARACPRDSSRTAVLPLATPDWIGGKALVWSRLSQSRHIGAPLPTRAPIHCMLTC
jgi:hypothetical protein